MHRNYIQKLFKALIFGVAGWLYSQEKMLVYLKLLIHHYFHHEIFHDFFTEILLYFTEGQ